MIDFYNSQVRDFGERCRSAGKDAEGMAKRLIDTDPKKIKWTRGLIGHFARVREAEFTEGRMGIGLYRPFSKQWLYYDRQFNEYFKEKIFPTTRHQNLAIGVIGVVERKGFSCLIVDALPNLHTLDTAQFFPLYHYERAVETKPVGGLFDGASAQADEDGYVRRDAIHDAALSDYRAACGDESITKEDLFFYVYGLLHAPDYRERFAADLKKMLPRIPRPARAEDFWAFSKAGRALADLHLNYETIEPYPLQEVLHSTIEDWRVVKMRYPSKADKTAILYNAHLTLKGIPPEALEYVVNGKPAIEVLMDQYQVTTDKDSGIVNDPNRWAEEHGQPRYIVDLIKRVVRVSVETVKIVKGLPALGEAEN